MQTKTNPLPQPPTLKWTLHVKEKMRFYGLSESRIKRVIKYPTRIEKGIAPNTIAAMQSITKYKHTQHALRKSASNLHKSATMQEIWVMYQDKKGTRTVITAWRYPGKSPVREAIPLPTEIEQELECLGYTR
ncbi:MAG: hypothetical protein AB1352_04670 [Patescibacteria group bacterium]